MARWARRVLVASALAASFPAAALPRLQQTHAGLTDAERRAADVVVAGALERLPVAWAQALPPLRLSWRDDLGPRVAGHYDRRGIRLRRDLLAEGRASDRADASHNAAVAALVHELAHAWDRSPTGRLSSDPRLLDLAGWPVSALTGRRGHRNDFRDRSPDAYERASAAEFVAVNLEHVLLDVDYACRRPALYRYFATRMALPPAPACNAPTFVSADATAPLVTIDPARVYAVDYLLAEPDRHPMSRWGHAMLRLVVCAPERAPGPACRNDLDHHVVLSFRAFVDDVQVSSWRGLTGRYPSRLFVLPLPQVVDEYTKVELRGLRSIPLTLSRDEIAEVVSRAAQVHWSYDGRYRFVTNNCAVETWRLLHDAVPRIAGADVGSTTPTGLLQRLERAGIADRTPATAEDAVRLGFRFESQDAYYAALYDTARSSLQLSPHRVDDWLALAPARRTPWIERTDLRSAAALLVLESAELRRSEVHALDALKHRLSDDDRTAVRAALQLADTLSRPSTQVPDGYGLPQPHEIAALQARAAATATQWQDRQNALREAGASMLPPDEQARLAALRANVHALGERLRALARQTGVPAG